MATNDARIRAWDLWASAGTTTSLEFTSSEALASLSVHVGGTVSDVDDLAGATEHVAVLSGGNLVATVDVPVPDATVKSTPLRLVVNGVVQTVGVLIPTSLGSESPGGTVTLIAGSVSFDLAVIGASPVKSVAGRTGDVVLAKADVGLADVDNTADLAKPVSTAQQAALDAKAPLASPTFTGTPAAPTPAAGDNTTKIATTAFVRTEVANGTSGSTRPASGVYAAGRYYWSAQTNNLTLEDGTEYATILPLAEDKTLDLVFVHLVTVAAGSVTRFGIREDNAAVPGDLIADLGTVDSATATGMLTKAVSQAVTAAKRPWLTVTAQGGSPVIKASTNITPLWSVGRTSLPADMSGAQQFNAITQVGVSGALPSTFSPSGGRSAAPVIGVRFSA